MTRTWMRVLGATTVTLLNTVVPVATACPLRALSDCAALFRLPTWSGTSSPNGAFLSVGAPSMAAPVSAALAVPDKARLVVVAELSKRGPAP